MKTMLIFLLWSLNMASLFAQNPISNVWVADLGDGSYKNPILYADYSDPDVCRVGDDFYMTASSFNCIPGLPILHSKDLVNWTIIGHAINKMPDHANSKQVMNHGGSVWAPSIRYHKGEFYIYYGDPDLGVFMTKTKDPAGEWEPLVLVKEGKGLIDACPLFDEDGQVYLAHAYAGSRAGIKSLLAVTRLTPDGKKAVGESQIIYDGHDADPTIEGPKFYKKNKYYYIFAPAGGVSTGWQTVLRSKSITGPYERKVVMDQGKTTINGPHQGGWVDTQTGEDWFIHFQDVGALGRIVHLQPMAWKNDWPVIGEDKKGDGCGQPVLTYKKPNVGKTYPTTTPVESDEFNHNTLGFQWQWHANPMSWWYFANQEKGHLSLYSVPQPDDCKNLWDVPNLLLQKMPSPDFVVTMKLTFIPDKGIMGEHTGLLIMGRDYSLLSFESKGDRFTLSQIDCYGADRGKQEVINQTVEIKKAEIYLRAQIKEGATCSFSYSLNNKNFTPLGKSFTLKEGQWIGSKMGMFCSRPIHKNDGGRADIDWFRVEKK